MPLVVIVGGGFAGLAAAKALRHAPVRVLVIDRTNHHLFQPLLYQVAICTLSPAQIASPIREILHRQQNTTVVMGEVVSVDKERKLVFVNSPDRERVPIEYDYLILATGATHSYFGHQEFEQHAPGLKTAADAEAIRNRILQAFEQAEAEEDPLAHRDLLTFVLVGGGPTGVEMAGALAVLVRKSLRSQFRRIDPTSARIVLVDMASRVLGTFAEDVSAAAKQRLERLGVEVRLGHAVDLIDEDGVVVNGERILSKTVIWTAGVAPSPAGRWLNVETDRAGRVKIQQDLTVPGHPEIFVLGDTATHRPAGAAAVSILRQGQYGRCRSGLRRPANWIVASERAACLVRVDDHPRDVSRRACAAGECVATVGVDVSDGTAGLASDCEPPRIGAHTEARRTTRRNRCTTVTLQTLSNTMMVSSSSATIPPRNSPTA